MHGKVAIVTGGSRGIGYAVVENYLANGASVALFASRRESVDKALQKLAEKYPNAPVMGLYPDLSDLSSVEEAFRQVKDRFGRIDILVNNAGISARESIFDYKSEDFERIISLNVTAVFNCSKVAAAYMRQQGGGVILNASSMVTRNGQSAGCGYPTSKYAINGLTRSLARELGPHHIRVNAVAPGVTRTDMVSNLPQAMVDRLLPSIPLGRMGEPEEVANAYLFLASDMASYITGSVLHVDGGAIT
nr:3-oxoacyl-ACP reductase family protein [Dysosmobacter acutus]